MCLNNDIWSYISDICVNVHEKEQIIKQSIAKYHCQAQHKFQFNLADLASIAFDLESTKYITEETDITWEFLII